MDNCYSADDIAEDHTHTDITASLRNHNKNTALNRSVIDYWGRQVVYNRKGGLVSTPHHKKDK